jgi:hypothetical protein
MLIEAAPNCNRGPADAKKEIEPGQGLALSVILKEKCNA